MIAVATTFTHRVAGLIASEGVDPARSKSPFLPEPAELLYGSIASILVFGALFVVLRKPVAKFFRERTERIQGELDAAQADQAQAKSEAEQIRAAAGDIDAERKRRFDEADQQAAALLAEGRTRLAEEVQEIEAKADADIAAAAGRSNDELTGEVASLANRATDAALAAGIVDAATQQELIEAFIARVGQGAMS